MIDPKTAFTPASRRDPVMAGFVLGVAGVAGITFLLFRLAGGPTPPPAVPAAAKAQGGVAPTGPHGAPAASGPADAEEAAAKAALERDPNDAEARLELARLRLDKQDYMAVWAETREVLKRAPDNARALTYQSQVRLQMGQPEVALEMLERAIRKEPTLLQAHIYLSYVHLGLGHEAKAAAVIAAAKRQHPQQSAWLEAGFVQMKNDLEKLGPPATAGANPHAGLGAEGRAANPHTSADPHAGIAADAARAPVAELAELEPAAGSSVSGTLELAASLQGKVPAGAVVFLTVREAGSPGGPPVAAKRLAASFPGGFQVGPADSMAGGPIPDRVVIEARIDTDGDASTREPSDPIARADGVKAGATGVRLVLARP